MATTPAVSAAIEELKASFPNSLVSVEEDGSGGAFVRLDVVELGSQYLQSETWIGFHVVFQYPQADIYPHYVRPDLARADGSPLAPPFYVGHPCRWGASVMISRRANRRDPATFSAAIKLIGVLDWVSTQ
jgi:hypothetical protein